MFPRCSYLDATTTVNVTRESNGTHVLVTDHLTLRYTPNISVETSYPRSTTVDPTGATCGGNNSNSLSLRNGSNVLAQGDLDHMSATNWSECAALCCARTPSCTAFVFDPRQGDRSGGSTCPLGQPCCWMKSGDVGFVVGPARFESGIVIATPFPDPPLRFGPGHLEVTFRLSAGTVGSWSPTG